MSRFERHRNSRFCLGRLFVFCGLMLMPGLLMAESTNPSLETYRFGEGIRLSDGDNYTVKLSGFIQPYAQFVSYIFSPKNQMRYFKGIAFVG